MCQLPRAVLFDLGYTLWQPRRRQPRRRQLRRCQPSVDTDWPDREPYPDALPTLRCLKENGFLLGIVSDQPNGPDCRAMLDYWQWTPLFDAVTLSCEVGCAKPDPRMFRSTLAALGVSPEEAVMVGDNALADVAGALAVGMRAVWRPQPGQLLDPAVHPDAIIETLAELPGILRQWQED